jgi:hypothetical protein
MRLRSTFAMLTVFLLFTISCVASACDATCAAKALGGGCHHAISSAPSRGKQIKQSMSGMSGCGMAAKDASKVLDELVLSDGACSHQVCEQAPTIIPSENGLSARQIATRQVVILANVFFGPETVTTFRTSETPPLRAPLLVSLQSILRV